MIDPQSNATSATNGPDHTGIEAMLTGDMRGMLRDQEDRAREFIRAHPVGVVLTALAIGFIAARLIRED